MAGRRKVASARQNKVRIHMDNEPMKRVLARNVKAIDAVKPEAARVNWTIKGEKGLVLAVHSTGEKAWYARYQLGTGAKRKRCWYEIRPVRGDGAAKSLQEICDECAETMGKAKAGLDPAGAVQAVKAADTFEALAERWTAFKRRQGRSESYTSRSVQRLAKLPSWFKDMKACEIKRVHVTGVLEDAARRGATTEVNRYQSFIAGVLSWASNDGIIEVNVARGVKRRFDENERDRVLKDAEVKAFWEGIATAPASEGSKLAMRLCLVLGQRPNEIAGLLQANLALDDLHPTAVIPKRAGKNKKTDHVVPLPKLAVALLREAVEIAKGSRWAFPNPEGTGSVEPHAFSKIIDRVRRDENPDRYDARGRVKQDGGASLYDTENTTVFGVRDAQLYDSKSTIATFLGEAGYPNQFIGMIFNHLTAKGATVTGKHYNFSPQMRQKREMVELWARHLEGIIGVVRAEPANVVQLATAGDRA